MRCRFRCPGCDPVETRRAVCHAQGLEQPFLEKLLERDAGNSRYNLAGHNVQQVVVIELRAKAAARFQVTQCTDNLLRRGLAFREHQQITGAEWKSAAMREQIA